MGTGSRLHFAEVVEAFFDDFEGVFAGFVFDDVPLGAADGGVGFEVGFPVDFAFADGGFGAAAEFLDVGGFGTAGVFLIMARGSPPPSMVLPMSIWWMTSGVVLSKKISQVVLPSDFLKSLAWEW